MRRIVLVLVLFLAGMQPALADIEVQDLVVSWAGPVPDKVNVRVTFRNPEDVVEVGPLQARLYVRADSSESWREICAWPAIGRLPAGYKVSRDYLPGATGGMDPALYTGKFELRAVIRTPDGREAVREERYPEETNT